MQEDDVADVAGHLMKGVIRASLNEIEVMIKTLRARWLRTAGREFFYWSHPRCRPVGMVVLLWSAREGMVRKEGTHEPLTDLFGTLVADPSSAAVGMDC